MQLTPQQKAVLAQALRRYARDLARFETELGYDQTRFEMETVAKELLQLLEEGRIKQDAY